LFIGIAINFATISFYLKLIVWQRGVQVNAFGKMVAVLDLTSSLLFNLKKTEMKFVDYI
jgi:hypothetical protein